MLCKQHHIIHLTVLVKENMSSLDQFSIATKEDFDQGVYRDWSLTAWIGYICYLHILFVLKLHAKPMFQ